MEKETKFEQIKTQNEKKDKLEKIKQKKGIDINEAYSHLTNLYAKQGYKISKNFKRILNQGTFGVVLLTSVEINTATSSIDQDIAVKIGLIKHKLAFESEVNSLNLLYPLCKYENVLCMVGFDKDKKYTYLISEALVDFKTLQDFISYARENISPSIYYRKYVPIIINQIISGIRTIHHNGLSHNDLKPGNIMVNPKTLALKIIDFGASCYKDKCEEVNIGTTYMYMAPEMWRYVNRNTAPKLEERQLADLWSIGIIVQELLNVKSSNWFQVWYTTIFNSKDIPENTKGLILLSLEQIQKDAKATDNIILAMKYMYMYALKNKNNYYIHISDVVGKELKKMGIAECFVENILNLCDLTPKKRNDDFIFREEKDIEMSIANKDDKTIKEEKSFVCGKR